MSAYLETSAEGAKLPLGYSRDGDVVTLRIAHEDWQFLMIMLGYGLAASQRAGAGMDSGDVFRLINSLNRGNPNYTPYRVANEQA